MGDQRAVGRQTEVFLPDDPGTVFLSQSVIDDPEVEERHEVLRGGVERAQEFPFGLLVFAHEVVARSQINAHVHGARIDGQSVSVIENGFGEPLTIHGLIPLEHQFAVGRLPIVSGKQAVDFRQSGFLS